MISMEYLAFRKNCGCTEAFSMAHYEERGELEVLRVDDAGGAEVDPRSDIELHDFRDFKYFEYAGKGVRIEQGTRIDYTCLCCGSREVKIEVGNVPLGFIKEDGGVVGK